MDGRINIILIFVLLQINWFNNSSKNSRDENDYDKSSERNPLYRKRRRFRKIKNYRRGSVFTSELKWGYFCQVIAALQILLLIVCPMFGRFLDDYRITKAALLLYGWCFLHTVVSAIVQTYYFIIFELAYMAVPWKKWNPFAFTGYSDGLMPTMIGYEVFKGFEEVQEQVWKSCKKMGYRLEQEEELTDKKKLFFWVKEERNSIKIFELIRFPYLAQEDIDLLNETFEEFLQRILKEKKRSTRIYFTFFICVDEVTRPFYYIMNRAVNQGIRRYRLPAGLALEEGRLEYADLFNSHGRKTYEKMCREFHKIMGIE